jgi:hypothetical protein
MEAMMRLSPIAPKRENWDLGATKSLQNFDEKWI